MRILVGYTRSGEVVEVPVEQDGRVEWLLSRFPDPESRYDVYCVLTYLRAREDGGWLLTAADRGDRFRKLLEHLLDDPVTDAGIKAARYHGVTRTTFHDLELGRSLVLPGLRR